MQFHHHPDNLVFVRDGGQVYQDTPINFAADLGEPYVFAGIERIYEPGVRHFLDGQPQPLAWPEGDGYIAALESLLAAQEARLNPPPTLEQLRSSASAQVLTIIAAFPGQVFNASPEKLEIYERKQLLVNTWVGEGIPTKPQVEWDGDWSLRAEFVTNGYVPVEALGMQFRCTSAVDLWQTWKLNTALGNYLDEHSEPLRTRAQADVAAAKDAAAIEAIVGKFVADLSALPAAFVGTDAPALIAASGLMPDN